MASIKHRVLFASNRISPWNNWDFSINKPHWTWLGGYKLDGQKMRWLFVMLTQTWSPLKINSIARTPRIQAGYQKHPTANVHWIISVSTPLDFHIYIYIWARLVISCPWLSMWLGTTTAINYLLIHAVHEANVHALNSVSYYVEICKAGKSRMTMKATWSWNKGAKVINSDWMVTKRDE